jgi:hypothetical protein
MTALLEILKAMGGITVVLVAWLAVQRAWGRAFPGRAPGGDALQGRTGCHGCTCDGTCENKTTARDAALDTN